MDAHENLFEFSEPGRTAIVLPKPERRKLEVNRAFWGLVFLSPAIVIAGILVLAWKG